MMQAKGKGCWILYKWKKFPPSESDKISYRLSKAIGPGICAIGGAFGPEDRIVEHKASEGHKAEG